LPTRKAEESGGRERESERNKKNEHAEQLILLAGTNLHTDSTSLVRPTKEKETQK
jgi:hypothetical protein